MQIIATLLGVSPHPLYNPDFVQSDFHLFGPLEEFLRGQHVSTDGEVELAVIAWFMYPLSAIGPTSITRIDM